MIKFFRRIRQTLISENKKGKYFKYAIGEIILVVIGILIALSINNWNEKRQNKLKVDNLLLKIQKEIELDLKEIASVTKYYATKDSLIQLVLNNKISKEDYKQAGSDLHYILWSREKINLKNNSFNNLIRLQDVIPKEYDGLLEQLYLQYNDRFSMAKEGENIFHENYSNFHKYLFEQHEWYSSQPFHLNNERIDYFLNNVRYKGMINEYRTLAIGNYLNFNIDYAYAAIDTYEQIDEILGNNSTSLLLEFERDSTLMGTYNSPFYPPIKFVESKNRVYLVDPSNTSIDSITVFQYDTKKFFMQNNFVRFDKANDSINLYVRFYENGTKTFATKIEITND